MEMDRTLYLVFSNPVEGREDDFNEWYDNVHVHEVLAIPGMLTAQRFDLFDAEITRNEAMAPQTHRYLTVYEMQGDVDAIMAQIGEAAMSGAMTISDSLDMTAPAMSYWTPRGPKLATK